ncbi:hypothetical protein [Sphingopyxis sp.]|jgi:hypothetical protein|uniref:hypothetical protein n=1 Tax=Sphingopyxis sp. TaxID=1908224 RepID=UPI002DE68BCA|nr:hypothetical protein [Sphingopyxis sp.]
MQFDASLFGPALRRIGQLIAAMPATIAVAWLLVASLGVMSDASVKLDIGLQLSVAIAYWVILTGVQVWLTGEALTRLGAAPTLGVAQSLGVVLQAILIALGITLGLLLLILPGLYVASRWYLAGSILILDGGGRRAAMERSWRLLEAHWPAALALSIIMAALSVGPFWLAGHMSGFFGGEEFLMQFILNLCSSTGIVGGYLAAVALLTVIEPPTRELQKIFS